MLARACCLLLVGGRRLALIEAVLDVRWTRVCGNTWSVLGGPIGAFLSPLIPARVASLKCSTVASRDAALDKRYLTLPARWVKPDSILCSNILRCFGVLPRTNPRFVLGTFPARVFHELRRAVARINMPL